MENNLLKRIVVTGPTGAVGIALINEMLKNDIQVVAICRKNSKRISSIPCDKRVRVIECNLDELHSINKKEIGECDAFYHFGWDGTYGTTRDDIELQNDNIRYTLEAVKVASKLHCKVFVGAGSQAEYGCVDGIIDNRTACNPVTGYGIAKLAASRLSRILCGQLGIRHEWCRIISLYGPYDGKYTMVMSSLIKMLNNEKAEFTKAEQIWDYIYSKDAALAFRLVAEKGKDGEVYCLGTGKPRMLKEYIMEMRNIVKPKTEIGIGKLEYYPNQVMKLCVDISNLINDTGFEPQYTFEEGIKETIEWIERVKYNE